MQTMHCLHVCNLGHMDVTSSNIMLQQTGYKAWDQLGLLDFGFAQLCRAGNHPLLAWLHSRLFSQGFCSCELFKQSAHILFTLPYSCPQHALSYFLLIAAKSTV